jgi:hypothetical protein
VGVRAYTDEGLPCGETHPRAHVPDAIVHEIRDRVENRREGVAAILADLRAREYVICRRTIERIAAYETRAAVPHEWRNVHG